MKIELNERNIILTAIGAAEKGELYNALSLLARCNGYEAQINRIVLLCLNGDTAYATDVYMQFKRRFAQTHNYYFDITRVLPEHYSALLGYVENGTPNKELRSDENKLYADRSLLYFPPMDDDDDDFANLPDLDFIGDWHLWGDEASVDSHRFFLSNSVEYYEQLRAEVELAYIRGDEQRAQELSERFLEIETDHARTLEAQIAISLFSGNDKHVRDFVKRLSENPEAGAVGIASAVEALDNLRDKADNDLLRTLLERALKFSDEISTLDLEDFAAIATTRLRDVQLALKFAKILYADYRNSSIESLKMCAIAFFNAGENEFARDAALALKRVVPEDPYAKVLLRYINTHNGGGEVTLNSTARMSRHYGIPLAIAMQAQGSVIERLQDEQPLTEDDYISIEAMLWLCKSLLLDGKNNRFWTVATISAAIISTAKPQNTEEFIEFALRQLAAVITESVFVDSLLEKLMAFGYSEKVLTPRELTHYWLDLSVVTLRDELYLASVAAVAAVCKLSATSLRRMEKYYNELREELREDFEKFNYRQIAYCLAMECAPRFPRSQADADFSDEDKILWKELNPGA